ncbi:granulocyte-macrophage colony-stimulating factor receptor subunit alpha-like isoform X2 [Eleginops maclovinus]|uniref:granulocyte-macrophage colony-stimulating factor receptor subunit alpha-like isoform X2 n=1 Tax=Eleginops maclovinus TaxID=56733 RepID=UPI0030801995
MKLFPAHPILWSSLLVLFALQIEAEVNISDVCEDKRASDEIDVQTTSVQLHYVEMDQLYNKFHCLLYPTNILNCSWSFNTLHQDTQLFVNISICDGDKSVQSADLSSEEKVGSRSLALPDDKLSLLILHFNVTLHDKWTFYTSKYDLNMLEVLSPPPNISASIKDGGLLVTWDLPQSRVDIHSSCFEYQLDISEQPCVWGYGCQLFNNETRKEFTEQRSYRETNVDLSSNYRVRMRTRKSNICVNYLEWSEWSHAVTVEKSTYKFNNLVIVSISLGIPMILLAVLLLLRHQRLSKVLFPPIPRPPQKYQHFLEKNDTFNSAEPAEEITEVEDMEQKPG